MEPMNKLIKHHALEMNLHVTRIFIFDKKKKIEDF